MGGTLVPMALERMPAYLAQKETCGLSVLTAIEV
jgi:hypothetical protein